MMASALPILPPNGTPLAPSQLAFVANTLCRPGVPKRGVMSRSVSIFGLGYVGAVTAACLAHIGHTVWGVDPNPIKVEALQSGRTPIVEAEVGGLISEARTACRIFATSEPEEAVRQTEISFISVGTPNLRNGRLDLSHVQDVGRQIGAALRSKTDYHWIVLRSTVLPGTTDDVVTPILEQN